MITLKIVREREREKRSKYLIISTLIIYLTYLIIQLNRTRTENFQVKQFDIAVPLVKVDEDIMNR